MLYIFFDHSAWDLLDLRVSLDVNLDVITFLTVDGLHGLDCEVGDKVAPLRGELGADAGGNDLLEVVFILDVNGLLFAIAIVNM